MLVKPFISVFLGPKYLLQVRSISCQVTKFCQQATLQQSQQSENSNDENKAETQKQKLLKVAVIGLPNVGKSTLVNQLVKRRIFAMSKKVHTTTCRARGVYIEDKTQLVFLDTPGLVSSQEKDLYKLDHEFVQGGKKAAKEADSLLVIQDASNAYTRYELDEKVIAILEACPGKKAALVINKVDAIKRKRFLLDMARLLTNDSLKKITDEVKTIKYKPITKMSLEKRIAGQKGYSEFNDIFMVSALDGTGIEELRNYLLTLAAPSSWMFSEEIFTDQDPVIIVQDTVRSRLLNDLPQEVPYRAEVTVEHLDFDREEPLCICLIECPSQRVERIVLGPGGTRIRRMATVAEEELRLTFKVPLRLKLVSTNKSPKKYG